MLRRHLFLVIVTVLAIHVLAITESRRIVGMQIRYLITGRAYPGFSFEGDQWPEELRKMAEGSRASLKDPWETYIAKGQVDRSKRLDYCKKAVAAEPNRPEPYAATIIAYAPTISYNRPEARSDNLYDAPESPAEYLDPNVGYAVLDLCKKGSHFDPNNAFFDIMAADALFGMRRDGEALRHVKAAAGKDYFNDYVGRITAITEDYLEAIGLPGLDVHVSTKGMILFPHYFRTRKTVFMVRWYARQLDAHGDNDQAKELIEALIQIGSLMRSGSSNMVTTMVGIGIQGNAGEIERVEPLHGNRTEQQERAHLELIANNLRKHGWPDVAARWKQEMLSAEEYHRQQDTLYHSALPYGFGIVLATHIASIAFMMTPVFFLTALLIWLGLKSRQALESMPEMRLPGKIGLAILTLVPWALATIMAAVQRLDGNGDPLLPDYFYLGGTHSSVEWIVVLDSLALCSWLVFVLIRSMPDVRNPWRLPKVVLLTLLMVGLLLLSVTLVFMVGGDPSIPIYVKLGLCLFGVLAVLAAGRAAILRRSGKCLSVGMGILDTLRQSSLMLCKTLLVVYLIALLVQLPFRAEVMGILRSL